ncbi:MAG: pilus assembly protein PilM [Candidatus Pacebacteria bacterium]|nr:pilus assembly protein PilM [Candidatus Paceibacterota bacterium]
MKRLYNHYFPTPSYLAMNSCAIDISDQSIKYGELKITPEGLHLSKYGKEKIPEGVVVSGKIEKEEELVKILRKIKEKENLNFIRVSLPEEQMYLFTLSIPKTNDEDIRDMILLQIEGYVPLKAPDVVFDYDIIEEDNQNILIEVVAIANSTIESYMSVFKKADLVPVSFEIEAQALARAVIPSYEADPIMIVDLGETRTGISISKNGRVYLTTTLSIGGADLTNMIAKNFSLSFAEAEKMKLEYGLNTGSKAENIFPAILNGISVLRDEINKQYIYWETHNSNNPKHQKINHIILCGGDANLTGLSDYLEVSLKVKVENANVWINILNIEKSVPEISFEESLSYATVLGLALGGYLYKSQPVINILPEFGKKLIRREYWMRFSVAVLNMLIIAGLVSTLLLFPPYFLSKSKEVLVQDRLETLNKENPELDTNNIDKITSDINSKLKILNSNEVSYQVNDKVFSNILSSRTEGVTFSQLLFTKKTADSAGLEIHGVATNRDSLRNFKTVLENNLNFSEVNLPISNFLEKTNLIFTISITIKN